MINKNQTTSASTEQCRFVESLEYASRIVQTWPLWKQTVLGDIGTQKSQPQSCRSTGQTSTGENATNDSAQP